MVITTKRTGVDKMEKVASTKNRNKSSTFRTEGAWTLWHRFAEQIGFLSCVKGDRSDWWR